MRRRTVAVIVSVCSVAVVLSLLFLYVTEFPFFHQSDVMSVGQLNTGIKYWRDFYVGRNVTVKGTLEDFEGLQMLGWPRYNSLLKENYLNETKAVIGVNLNWTEYSSLLGRDVVVCGIISDNGGSVYIEAELVMDAVTYALINAF